MDEAGLFGPVSASVVLDGSGSGFVQFQATGEKLEINNTAVSANITTPEAIAKVYKNQIGQLYLIAGSYAGSTGDNNNDTIRLNDGDKLFVVWTGGAPGATAVATISGWASIPGRGFRAVH